MTKWLNELEALAAEHGAKLDWDSNPTGFTLNAPHGYVWRNEALHDLRVNYENAAERDEALADLQERVSGGVEPCGEYPLCDVCACGFGAGLDAALNEALGGPIEAWVEIRLRNLTPEPERWQRGNLARFEVNLMCARVRIVGPDDKFEVDETDLNVHTRFVAAQSEFGDWWVSVPRKEAQQ